MKIIHKYVLREHLGPMLFALSALTSIMLLNYVAKQLGNLVGKGLPWTVIAEFFVLSIPFTVAMTMPMAILVAVLYAFSRLAADNEITALKANGVSIVRLLVPVLIAGAFLSVVMILFNDQLLPRTNHVLRTLQGDIARKKPTFALREQIINEVAPGRFYLRANHLDQATSKLRDVTIYDLSDPIRRRTIYADSGYMAFATGGSDLHLTLYNGFMQEVPKEKPEQLQRMYYIVDLVRVAGVGNAFERDTSDNYKSDREMSVCELQNVVARHEVDYFRAYDDYTQAAAATKKNPAALVDMARPVAPLDPGVRAPRSQVRSLGRAYCDALYYLEKKGLGKLTMLAASAGSLLAPRLASAQEQARDTIKQKGDSTRVAVDTSRRRVDASAAGADSARQRPDSVRARPDSARPRPDSARSDSVVPGIRPPATTPPTATQPATAQPETPIPAPPVATATPPLPGLTPGVPPNANVRVAPSTGLASGVTAIAALEASRNAMLQARGQMDQYAVEIQKKFAISLACIVFVLLGAPIALRFPRGGVGLTIGVSLVVFGLYYVGLIAGEALGDRGMLSPFFAMQLTNIILTVVGLVMLSRIGGEGATARGGDLSELLERARGLARALRLGRPRSESGA